MTTVAYGRTTADLIQIAASGAGFWMDPMGRTTAELVQIVSAAKNGGGTVTIMGTYGRSTAELIQIGSAGRGHVVFGPRQKAD